MKTWLDMRVEQSKQLQVVAKIISHMGQELSFIQWLKVIKHGRKYDDK